VQKKRQRQTKEEQVRACEHIFRAGTRCRGHQTVHGRAHTHARSHTLTHARIVSGEAQVGIARLACAAGAHRGLLSACRNCSRWRRQRQRNLTMHRGPCPPPAWSSAWSSSGTLHETLAAHPLRPDRAEATCCGARRTRPSGSRTPRHCHGDEQQQSSRGACRRGASCPSARAGAVRAGTRCLG
jgi:hypothetical protein